MCIRDSHRGVHTTILAAAVSGVALIFIGIGLSRPLLELTGTPSDVIDQAELYMSCLLYTSRCV